ncbi:MAG: hypothetical protein ABH858_05640 [Candidatus Omnitrophota bacterium]
MAKWRNNKLVGIAAGVITVLCAVAVAKEIGKAFTPPLPRYVSVVLKGKIDTEGNPYVEGMPVEEVKNSYGYTDKQLKDMNYTIVIKSEK